MTRQKDTAKPLTLQDYVFPTVAPVQDLVNKTPW